MLKLLKVIGSPLLQFCCLEGSNRSYPGRIVGDQQPACSYSLFSSCAASWQHTRMSLPHGKMKGTRRLASCPAAAAAGASAPGAPGAAILLLLILLLRLFTILLTPPHDGAARCLGVGAPSPATSVLMCRLGLGRPCQFDRDLSNVLTCPAASCASRLWQG